MGLAQNIKRRRMEMGLSQQHLANALGYRTRSSIAKIESGSSVPPHGKLVELARILDTTLESLYSDAPLGGEDSPCASEQVISPTSRSAAREKTSAIILAGGVSSRNLQNVPNQFINILGKPVIMYCLEAYQRHPMVDQIYVVCLRQWTDILGAYARQAGITKLVKIIPAGESGILSVRNGLAQVRLRCAPHDLVILQESTRPLVTQEDISKLIQLCRQEGSATVCSPMKDYVQIMRRERALSYVDRSSLYSIESPEAYRISVLADALEEAGETPEYLYDNSCSLMFLNMGKQINVLECGHNNMKVVRQEDIDVVTALLRRNG
ncbi:MAG: XRE family transcriptional regulator [Eggerthellales bacterium]|nr:XRE family transcriptional regulator [Eggerthellales bacterium]